MSKTKKQEGMMVVDAPDNEWELTKPDGSTFKVRMKHLTLAIESKAYPLFISIAKLTDEIQKMEQDLVKDPLKHEEFSKLYSEWCSKNAEFCSVVLEPIDAEEDIELNITIPVAREVQQSFLSYRIRSVKHVRN